MNGKSAYNINYVMISIYRYARSATDYCSNAAALSSANKAGAGGAASELPIR